MKKFIYDEELYKFERSMKPSLYTIAAFTVLGIGLCVLSDCSKESEPIVVKSHYSETERAFIEFFGKHGSRSPEEMAVAVVKTKRPALMAAIAVKESNGNPDAIGDNGDSHGAFQVQPKHWGKVPATATEQALQAERILEELLSSARHLRRDNARLRVALARYNGGNRPPKISYRYAKRVLELKREISC